MAIVLTIPEAEAAYLEDVREKKAEKDRELHWSLYGSLILLVLAPASFILFQSLEVSEDAGKLLSLISISLVLFALFAAMNFAVGRIPKPSSEALQDLRTAQYHWVKDHGFKIPEGSFSQLAFAVIPTKGSEQIYGVAQLIEVSTDRLVSISLRSDPEGNYELFSTDGQILRPTSEIS